MHLFLSKIPTLFLSCHLAGALRPCVSKKSKRFYEYQALLHVIVEPSSSKCKINCKLMLIECLQLMQNISVSFNDMSHMHNKFIASHLRHSFTKVACISTYMKCK